MTDAKERYAKNDARRYLGFGEDTVVSVTPPPRSSPDMQQAWLKYFESVRPCADHKREPPSATPDRLKALQCFTLQGVILS